MGIERNREMSALGTRLLKLEIDGDEVTAQISKSAITSGKKDSDFISFAEAAAGGGRIYKLNFIAVQDPEAGSLWDQVWANAGSTVAGTLMPYGNAAPSATQPHYTFNAVISEPDGDLLGG